MRHAARAPLANAPQAGVRQVDPARSPPVAGDFGCGSSALVQSLKAAAGSAGYFSWLSLLPLRLIPAMTMRLSRPDWQ